jgi:hypothetical protein
MIDKNTLELYELIVALHEGTLTKEQFARLNETLKQKENAQRYIEFIQIFSDLSCPSLVDSYLEEALSSLDGHAEQDRYTNIMMKFAEEENTAPAVDLPPINVKQIPVLTTPPPQKITYTLNRLSIITILASAAVFCIVVLFAKFAPIQIRHEVATLTESINAEWAQMPVAVEEGNRFIAGSDALQLHSGVAKILFDSGVNVVIEAPAEFMFLSENQIKLIYGQIYAAVPKKAVGFSVHTLNSEIIDLGTEFGVRAEVDGTSQVHVLQGKVNLLTGTHKQKISYELRKGQAKQVLGFTSQVTDITYNNEMFIRNIAAESHTIWRGEKSIDLADIASGGNGFGTAAPNMGIDLKTGILISDNSERRGGDSKGYIGVPELDFVDGVFVPNGSLGPVQVSSQGHTYNEFGTTNGQYYMAVGSYPSVNMFSSPKKEWHYNQPLKIKGYPKENPVNLCLHANAGITFDLQNIRQSVPFLKITRFSSFCGISETTDDVLSDFHVLVDGQPRQVKRKLSVNDQPFQISIPLEKNDRFLTLACTEGGGNFGDWSLFVDPVLEFEPVN